VHSKAKRPGHYSTAQHTIGADTHAQHFISHLEGACVVDGELAGLRAILLHNGPLPKLDFLIGTAAHKATAVMQHTLLAATTSEIANVSVNANVYLFVAQTTCNALNASAE